ncbi:MAG: hypothetical protein N2560_03320 [Ignavibacteria bacterium]|nr:hypothetical protein [Ignavibacteria bacterium]
MFEKQKNWLKILLLIALIGFLFILYVNNVINIKRIAKENLELKENYLGIKEINLLLTKKINEMEEPEKIIENAINKLGMKFPEKKPVVLQKNHKKGLPKKG